MGLIAALPDIDKYDNSVFVMHEASEKLIPFHKHTKGQLSYVEGGIAYITIVLMLSLQDIFFGFLKV